MKKTVSESAQLLICPLDQCQLRLNGNSWQCEHKHQYDIARQGYVNLLPVQHKRSKSPGDTKEMVQARRNFLATGAYQAISEQLNQIIIDHKQTNTILDAGCGEGYYLNRLNQKLTENQRIAHCFGLDIAKFAIQAAAKSDKKSHYLVASNRSVPIADSSLDIIYCAFGFPVFEEFTKKLKPDGKLILVESGEQHLIELRKLIYPNLKPYRQNPYPEAAESGFSWTEESSIQYKVTLDKTALANLLLMTPHIHKASAEKKQQLAELEQLELSVDVNFRVLNKDAQNL